MKKQRLQNPRDWSTWKEQFGEFWGKIYISKREPSQYPCVVVWMDNCGVGIQYEFVYRKDII